MLEGCDVEIPPECYEEGSTATSLPTLLSTLIIVFIIDLMVGVCMSLLQTEIGFGSSMKELFPSSVLKAEVMLLIGRSCNNKRSVYVQASTFFTCSSMDLLWKDNYLKALINILPDQSQNMMKEIIQLNYYLLIFISSRKTIIMKLSHPI